MVGRADLLCALFYLLSLLSYHCSGFPRQHGQPPPVQNGMLYSACAQRQQRNLQRVVVLASVCEWRHQISIKGCSVETSLHKSPTILDPVF